MTIPSPRVLTPGSFEAAAHFYPRVLNAHIHPLVRAFLSLGNDRVAERYVHLHPNAAPEAVRAALDSSPRFFRWGGADLLHVATEKGTKKFVVVETNSCPSGNKSLPKLEEVDEQGGYRRLMEHAFLPLLARRKPDKGRLAVLYDKNPMEASGYAATLADLVDEPVHLVPCFDGDPEPAYKFTEEGALSVRDEDGSFVPVRGAVRYVTQRPWNRIPAIGRTPILNPVLVCLAGGRNKMLAAKAYDLLNARIAASGLRVHVPETIWDVSQTEVPMWVTRMGGYAVVKVPYSNAGQGVYTITTPAELEAFMATEHGYDRFIVQALVGNSGWSSLSREGRIFHVGTLPDKKLRIFVADLRFMVGASDKGFFPVAIYARHARDPLATEVPEGTPSWNMLGTNLSVRVSEHEWTSQTERLMLMDSRDFNRVGLGLDDLIDAYVQTVLAVTAIDEMARTLVTQKGRFRRRFFSTLNPDPALVQELLQ